MRIGYNFIGKLPLILGIFLALIGKKRYFLALGTIPVNGVGFIGRKITVKVGCKGVFITRTCLHVGEQAFLPVSGSVSMRSVSMI